MKVNIRNIVSRFKMQISIMQTLYEAIANSLEANATHIEIILKNNNMPIEGLNAYYEFLIIDDGDGFNEANINSFLEYLSSYKIKLGCKGIGRFTRLTVFKDIEIESKLSAKTVIINFSLDFDESNKKCMEIIQEESISPVNETKIIFKNCLLDQSKYINMTLREIKEQILDHFALKFYLLKQQHKEFNITIKDNCSSEYEKIDFLDIINMNHDTFQITTTLNTFHFNLYFSFVKNGKNKRNVVLCANGRAVKELNIVPELPDKASFICLVISDFLDENVDDSRTELLFNEQKDGIVSISLSELIEEVQRKIDEIIIKEYPQINDKNAIIEKECIDEFPHLKNYIKSDRTIIKNKKKIIEKAKKQYENDKEDTRNTFTQLLKSRNIDNYELIENINKLNDISNKELAQYIMYRQQIIDCLGKYNANHEKIESLLHDLFIKRGTELSTSYNNRLDNNIWLLDDKFMSCKNLFSDKKVKAIKKAIMKEDKIDGIDDDVEPDMTIFYENNIVVVVEFKALGANYNKKIDAISEISRNQGIVASNIDNINVIYGYIITQFDEVFLNRIKYQPSIRRMRLYSNSKEGMFYIYNENIINKEGLCIPCHTYILSTDSIYKDADARNKTFIDILKKQ